MHLHDLFLSSCILFMIVILSGHVPTSLGDEYTNCSQSYQCANIGNISYPFWGGNRSEYCGHPSFHLNCSGEAPVITIQTTPYRVLSIDYTLHTLTVVREEFWSNSCLTNPNSASLDTNYFNYTSGSVDLMLYYGCAPLGPLPNQFTCTTTNGSNSFGIFVSSGFQVPSNVTMCQTDVTVRVNQTEAQGLLVNPASITQVLKSGFGLNWAANNSPCDVCVASGGRCGYNSTSFVCYCPNQTHPFTCDANTNRTGSNKGNRVMLKFGIGFSVSMLGITILLIILIYCVKRRRTSSMEDRKVEAFMRQYGSLAPKQYRYSDLSKITNSFKNKLGQGGYGSVYKGKLSDGRLVAVKVLSETKGGKGEGEDFINEVASITRTSHVNVVALLGFCFEKNKRALVYEFVAKGSLDKFIYQNDDELGTNCHLELQTLYQIAVGVARGLEYLHRGCSTRIVHFDIKPQNILLDEDFCPKISDFGLAKLCRKKQSHISMLGARGTVGYIAPEVFSRTFGEVSYKSDVYSYGMLVLEMIGARNNIGEVQTSEVYFPHWIYEHLNHGNDLRLRGVTTGEDKETARKLILVGLWCIQTNPLERPPMSKVLEMLEGNLQSLETPPKPFLFSAEMPEMSAKDSSKLLPTVNMGVEILGAYPQSSVIRSKNTLLSHTPWFGPLPRDPTKSI